MILAFVAGQLCDTAGARARGIGSKIQIGSLVAATPAHEIVEKRPKIITAPIIVIVAVGIPVVTLAVLAAPPLQEYATEDPILRNLHIQKIPSS